MQWALLATHFAGGQVSNQLQISFEEVVCRQVRGIGPNNLLKNPILEFAGKCAHIEET